MSAKLVLLVANGNAERREPNQALIKKYVVKGLPYALAPSTLAGRVRGPLGRLEIFGSGCTG